MPGELLARMLRERARVMTRCNDQSHWTLHLSPRGRARLQSELEAMGVVPPGCPYTEEVLGFRVHRSEHLPEGVDFLLVEDRGPALSVAMLLEARDRLVAAERRPPRPPTLSEWAEEACDAALHEPPPMFPDSAPAPEPVRAESFEEWRRRTAALLAEATEGQQLRAAERERSRGA